MAENNYVQLSFEAGSVFTPGAPVNERDLFMGRTEQVGKILDAISQRGYHAVLYGERGVGKTSLSNVLGDFIRENSQHFLVPRVNCDGSDTFSSLWKKALQDLAVSKRRPGIGFGADEIEETEAVIDGLPDQVTPDDVRRVLDQLSKGIVLVVVFDEFDRLTDTTIQTLMADTIKALSDYGVAATVLLIGVADSVDGMIREHQSIERALVQIPMPRMSPLEIQQIVENGLLRLSMSAIAAAREEIVALSQGLPYITHLLALHSARAAIRERTREVTLSNVDSGIRESLDQWQETIKLAYYTATKSQQPGHLYREVLLACALADVDDLGYFAAASVRTPLRAITGKSYDIPNFARHLKGFSEKSRGALIERVGGKYGLRYRFRSPIMRPYIAMRGFADGLLTRDQMRRFLGGA